MDNTILNGPSVSRTILLLIVPFTTEGVSPSRAFYEVKSPSVKNIKQNSFKIELVKFFFEGGGLIYMHLYLNPLH